MQARAFMGNDLTKITFIEVVCSEGGVYPNNDSFIAVHNVEGVGTYSDRQSLVKQYNS